MSALALLLLLAALPPELAALQEHLARSPGVSAHFVQKRRWAALKDVLESSGTVQFERDGRLLWRTEKPSANELVLLGSKATMKSGRLGTSQTFDLKSDPGMAAVFESLAALVRADFPALEKQFALEVLDKSPVRVGLKPRSEALAAVVTRIELKFDAARRLSQVTLEEASADRTELVFSGHSALDGGALP